MNQAAQSHVWKWGVCVLLAAVTLAVFAPVTRNDFIYFDDPNYVLDNPSVQPGLTWGVVKWAFTSFQSSNWHPLTWLSHALDCQLYGLNPAGHHLTNLALHAANAVLLFLLLHQLTGRLKSAAFAALLFGIHPMHVESVAWIAERKDVLSGFFFMLTLLAYAFYVQKAESREQPAEPGAHFPSIRLRPGCGGPAICHLPSAIFYLLSLGCFALGLMSKPMLVTVPCVLLLLDYWPLQRFTISALPTPHSPLRTPHFRQLLLEKLPFFALAAFSCWITVVAQARGQAVKPIADFPLPDRLLHAGVACAWYVGKVFWPVDLSIYHVLRNEETLETAVVALLALGLATALAVAVARSRPYFLFGWLWFLIMLVPVIGLVQVGNQAYADRYTYLPYIGLFIILAWGAPALLAHWPARKFILAALALGGLAAAGALTRAEVARWRNTQVLFERAIALDRENQTAFHTLAMYWMRLGNPDQAAADLRRATVINPTYYQAWIDLGRVQAIRGDFAEAQAAYQTALRYADNKQPVYNNLGNLFLRTGRYAEAIASYRSSLAMAADQPVVHCLLARSLVQAGQAEAAAAEYEKALQLQPNLGDAELGLALILQAHKQEAEAIAHFRRAVALLPNSVPALNNLAWLLTTAANPQLRNGAEAVQLAERACSLTRYEEALLIGTLAAAYAQAGRFSEAATCAQQAQDAALAHGQKEIADANQRLRERYQSGQTYPPDP